MKKQQYQIPQLTVVSFKAELGFAESVPVTRSIDALFGGGEGGVEERSSVSAFDNSGW